MLFDPHIRLSQIVYIRNRILPPTRIELNIDIASMCFEAAVL